ncbi:sensor histidine kinase [Paenibacillus donghaensis]|uniref:histidine kinase n=1 Tax=Paenibacillus donghaensis TaxID=414771 RepID=A0A2Z2K625_9BACL|nr:sensor histidine kinase [Paenibacillus donghaensis]ASA20127.1 two-component sensor histidine kinase [Paenibacillus donghaensis]
MKLYRNLSIKSKVFLMIILIMILIITLAFSSLYYAYSVYDRQLYNKSYRLLNLSSTTVDLELKKLEAVSLAIIADRQIQKSLKDLLNEDADYSAYLTRQTIVDRLWSHISMAERYVQSVQLIDSKGKVNRYGETITIPEDKYARMIDAAHEGGGAVRWLYPDDVDPMLIMVREVRSYEPMTLEKIGILYLRINIERLAQDYAGVASEDSDIILKSGQELVYPYGKVLPSVAAALQPLNAGDGYEIKEMNGDIAFVSQKHSSYTGWTYYNFVRYNDIFEKTVWLKNTMIVVFVLAIVIVCALGMGFARNLTKPIRLLISQMKEVQYGDLDHMDSHLSAPAIQQMDEVGLLQRTFRLMIARINTLIKENYANQLVIKETEFKALQAQINPHFLYNTLDSIHWLAKKSKHTQISSMVISLGYLLRSSISLKQNVITVAEELEIVKHYITIQKHRFQHRLDFHMNVPETFYGVSLPKLTLQPLLENAIQYGVETMIEPCRITLSAELMDDKFALIVEDLGPGMEEEFLQRVLRGEVQTRGTGIGLLNIRDRIQLAFGEDYGIRVESVAGAWTRVIVLLPFPQEV